MLNKKNLVVLEGGLTKDPQEFENANVVHLSVAVDNAGSEKGVQYASGYFDVKVWLNDSKFTPAALAENVRNAIKDGSLRKGTKVSIIGNLKQERWEKDGQRSSKVVVVAESIEIYTSSKNAAAGAPESAKAAGYAASTNEPTFVPNF